MEAVAPKHLSAQSIAAWVEARLYKAVRAEHVKAAKQANATAWKQAVQSNVPKTAGDMAVKGTTPEGKLTYRWEAVEVDVTPRGLRADVKEDASAWAQARVREATPERALRKMTEKVKRAARQAAKGKHAPIVVRGLEETTSTRAPAPSAPGGVPAIPEAVALASLSDPTCAAYARASFEYLDSARLHYCENCDEEWVVFEAEWPQGGVEWAGPLAGRCETIARAGYEASWRDRRFCRRCDT